MIDSESGMLNIAYWKCIVNHVVFNIKQLAGLQTRRSMRWKANSEKLFQSMRIESVPVTSISIETNQNHIHFQRNLKWNLHDASLRDTHIQYIQFTHQLLNIVEIVEGKLENEK